jgi:hypothetical protein
MAREIYSLTDQTTAVVTDNVGAIAAEMDVSNKYLYAILSEEKTDPYAPFRRLYAAAVRAGAPTCHWEVDLNAIKTRSMKIRPSKTEIECLTEKVMSDADTTAKLVDALRDGDIDEVERRSIITAIEKERRTLDSLEMVLGLNSKSSAA